MDVIDWLMDSDPAIRWQVMRDLTEAPEGLAAAERARVAREGWGAQLLALQQPHGQWPTGSPAFSAEDADAEQWWHSLGPARQGTLFPVWTSTTWSLTLLMAFGVDPASAAGLLAASNHGKDGAALDTVLLAVLLYRESIGDPRPLESPDP